MAPKQRKTTVRYSWSFNWFAAACNGIAESENFGATGSPIKFYLRLTKGGELSLRLAACPHNKLYITKFRLTNSGPYKPTAINLSGELSLDRSSKLSYLLHRTDSGKVDCLITYEEPISKPLVVIKADHNQKLADHLATFRLNIRSDVTLVTVADGMEHPAHKSILSVRSPVFAAMFKHEGLLENVQNRVDIEDVTGETMEAFLDYIYSGDISEVGQFAGQLFELANKYDIQPLAQASIEAISVDSAAQLYYLTNLHQQECGCPKCDFKKMVMHFISKNKQAVKRSNGWKVFIKPNAQLLQQLIDDWIPELIVLNDSSE